MSDFNRSSNEKMSDFNRFLSDLSKSVTLFESKFAKEENSAIKKMKTNKRTEKQGKRNDAIWHLAEKRMELLDTIREMVKTEVNRQMEKVRPPKN